MARHSKAAKRMLKARTALMVFQPFYGTLLANLKLEETRDVPTAATDGRKLYYNPAFVDGLYDDEVLFLTAHEAAHCANLHHTRRGDRYPDLWNEAADYVINLDLSVAAIGKMPEGGLLDQRYAGLATEEVYAMLAASQDQGQGGQGDEDSQAGQEAPQGGQGGEGEGQDTGQGSPAAGGAGNPSQGQGAGDGQSQDGQGGSDQGDGQGGGEAGDGAGGAGQGQPGKGKGGMSPAERKRVQSSRDPGRCGGVIDAAPSQAERAQEEAKWQKITRQAIAVATRAAGSTPADIKRLAGELNKARVNWRAMLRRFIDLSTTVDYSWARGDRRFAGADFIMPGTVPDGVNHIVMFRDTSGSIDDTILGAFNSEIQAMLDEGIVDRVTVVDIDTHVRGVREFIAGDRLDLEPMGGGGTEFQPAWDWLRTAPDTYAAAIYFTDLYPNRDNFGTAPDLPVLWAAYGTDPRDVRKRMAMVPFGDAIEISE